MSKACAGKRLHGWRRQWERFLGGIFMGCFRKKFKLEVTWAINQSCKKLDRHAEKRSDLRVTPRH